MNAQSKRTWLRVLHLVLFIWCGATVLMVPIIEPTENGPRILFLSMAGFMSLATIGFWWDGEFHPLCVKQRESPVSYYTIVWINTLAAVGVWIMAFLM